MWYLKGLEVLTSYYLSKNHIHVRTRYDKCCINDGGILKVCFEDMRSFHVVKNRTSFVM